MRSSPNLILNPSKKISIGIIGAGGKIGQKVLKSIWGHSEKLTNLEKVVALNTLPKVNFGMFLDYTAAFPEKIFSSSIETILTNEPAKLKDLDIIFIMAGLWPNETMRNEIAKKDNTGRLVQSIVNFPLIKKICADIKSYSPNAIVYVITNQVDIMTELTRQELPKHTVIGVGGHIDTMRYKLVLATLLHKAGHLDTANPNRIEAHLVGYHNNDMVLLQDSLRVDGKTPDFNNPIISKVLGEAIEMTRTFGKTVSDLQKHPNRPNIDSGSSIAPAKAITDVITAMCSDTPLIASFNVTLDKLTAQHYGVPANSALSIPIVIQGLHIQPLPIKNYSASTTEKEQLCTAQQKLLQDIKTLFDLKTNRLPMDETKKASIGLH